MLRPLRKALPPVRQARRHSNALAPSLPELLGGSADLTGSNLTNWTGVERLTHDNMLGRHISYGVREFGMAGIQNGIALYGGFIPFSRNVPDVLGLRQKRSENGVSHEAAFDLCLYARLDRPR